MRLEAVGERAPSATGSFAAPRLRRGSAQDDNRRASTVIKCPGASRGPVP